MKNNKEKNILALVLGIIAMAFLSAWVGMALWNGVGVKILQLPHITYWQFMGLSILVKILFVGNKFNAKDVSLNKRV